MATPREPAAATDSWLERLEIADRRDSKVETLSHGNQQRVQLAAALIDRPPPHAREGGIAREGFDARLDELRLIQRDGTELTAKLEGELRAQTGATSLRDRYNNVFGYYIEVTKSHLAKVPKEWRRKQTVAGGERYTNDALDDSNLAVDVVSFP